MTTKNITLAEALASGRPFKHRGWVEFVDMREMYSITIGRDEFLSSEWEIKPEELQPVRVWYDVTAHSSPITVCEIQPSNQHMEMSKALATALAPHLKDLLK